MAHALDATNRYPAANTTNAANPIVVNFTAGNTATAVAVGLIYAGTTNRAGGAPTYAGTNMSQANVRQGATECSAEIWYLCNIAPGAANISIPNTGTLATMVYTASFSAASGKGSAYDTANGANATSADPTSSVNTSTNGSAIFAVVASGLNAWLTGHSNQTGTEIFDDDPAGWGGGCQYVLQANAGVQAMGWTANSDDWGTVAVAFKEVDRVSNGTVSQTLGVTTQDITGAVNIAGVVAQTFAPVDATITGIQTDNGAVAQTLGIVDATITGTVASATKFNLAASDNIATGGTTNTTAQLTAPSGKTGANFSEGKISDDTNPLPSIDIASDGYTEVEFAISANAAVTTSEVYSFRITSNGTALDTYTLTPTWTIGETISNATVSQTLGVMTGTVTAIGTIPGSVAQALGVVDITATGTVAVVGSVAQTLGEVAISATATGAVTTTGDVGQTLEPIGAVVTGTVSVSGTVAQTLGVITANITGTVGTPIPFVLSNSTYIAANATTVTTAQLIAPANKTANAYFQAGRISDDTNPLPSVNLVVDCYTELEWCVRSTTSVLNDGTYTFRVTANGTPITTYTVTPTWISKEPRTADVAQTLGVVTANITGGVVEPGTGTVSQELGVVTGDVTGTTGRACDVSATITLISQPALAWDDDAMGGGALEGWNFYFGRTTQNYSSLVSYPNPTATQETLTNLAPDVGEWYVMVKGYNADGESDASNEVFVVVAEFSVTVEDTTGLAAVAQTLAPVSCAFGSRVAVKAQTAHTLGVVAVSSTGTVGDAGTIAHTLGAVASTSTATVSVSAEVTPTLGTLGSAATATVTSAENPAEITQTLGEVSATVQGLVYETGTRVAWVDALLDAVISAVEVQGLVAGDVSQTLDAVVPIFGLHIGPALRKQNTLLDGSELTWRS